MVTSKIRSHSNSRLAISFIKALQIDLTRQTSILNSVWVGKWCQLPIIGQQVEAYLILA